MHERKLDPRIPLLRNPASTQQTIATYVSVANKRELQTNGASTVHVHFQLAVLQLTDVAAVAGARGACGQTPVHWWHTFAGATRSEKTKWVNKS